MKAYMRVGGGGHFALGRLSPVLQANIDFVHRDEIGEIVSTILLDGFQKLQITWLFSIPYIITTNERVYEGCWGGHFTSG